MRFFGSAVKSDDFLQKGKGEKTMKPYFRVFYNFLKLRTAAFKNGANLTAAGVELFDRRARFLFKRNSNIRLGGNIVSDGRSMIVVDPGAELSIGNHVYMNENAMISCKGRIRIGDNCKFGPNVCIFDNNHRFSPETGVSDDHRVSEIHIGSGCWLGANVIILPGGV